MPDERWLPPPTRHARQRTWGRPPGLPDFRKSWLKERRKKKPLDLVHRFETTCGWCGRKIPPDTEVIGGGGKVRPGLDLTAHARQVTPIYLVGPDKTVLVAVCGPDSEARREGHDFLYLTGSEACARSLKMAFEGEIEMGKRLKWE